MSLVNERDVGAPLSEDIRDLLDAERELDAPAPDRRERLLAGLAPLLLVPPGVLPGPTDPAAAAAGAQTIAQAGWGAKWLVPALCAALGGAAGAAGHAYLAGSPASAPAPKSAVAVTPTAMVAPSAASAAPEPAAQATPPVASSGATPAASPPPSAASSLRGERLLLESATAALMRGDPATALATLQKHARLYPRGALVEEREVLWVKALRAQGNATAAEKRASDFKRKFPTSLQQGAIDDGGAR